MYQPKNSDIEIRLARPADLDPLLQLETGVFAGDRLTRRRLQHWIGATNGMLFCAFCQGNLAGYLLVIFRRNSRRARAYSLAVDPGYQRRGIARSLVARAHQQLQQAGHYKSIYLEVRPDNPAAIALYQGLGFRQTGRLPGFYQDGVDALRMEASL